MVWIVVRMMVRMMILGSVNDGQQITVTWTTMTNDGQWLGSGE